jgi:uncharacterized lipoprotein YddW (UPF0748 family)
VILLAGCQTTPEVAENPPPAPREFRGVWVATVANIDWPSAPGLPAAQQRAEAIAMLDRARALNLNAIILQVRPAADALYPSSFEPWTEYLTGRQGGDPGYDPLKFWVEEAHRRGLQLHAWFNPYRARHNQAKSGFAPTHIAKTHPASVKTYGDYWWMDPGDAFASQRTVEVVSDVVRRYDVDGVHIDDYFYPYPIVDPKAPKPAPGEPAATLDFPDAPSWKLYRAAGGKLSRDDWRRQNVDKLVERLYRAIHGVKPQVLFGVSPFGLGRPDRRPPGITGFSQYDKLYADVELWLEQGWLDYLAPQLYWPRDRKGQEFAVLLDYWQRQNPAHRHVWPGLFTSSINDHAEVLDGRGDTRPDCPRAGRARRDRAHSLQHDRTAAGSTRHQRPVAGRSQCRRPRWCRRRRGCQPRRCPPRNCRSSRKAGCGSCPARVESAASYAIWRRHGAEWRFSVQPAGESGLNVAGADAVVVSAVDRLGKESPRVARTFPRPKAN